MRALARYLILALLFAVALPAVAQRSSADDELYDRVRQRLAVDRDAKGGALQVDVKEGVVTISGKVHDDKQKNRCERVVRKTKGVKQVVNKLEVETKP